MSGSQQCFNPVLIGQTGMKEETADTVVECADDSFGLAVLGGSIGTG
jgi:hypothetical protein